MFFSDPFPQLPSSTNGFSLPNSFFDHEKDDVHSGYHQKNNDPFSYGDLLFHPYNNSAPPPEQFSEGSGLQHAEDHADLLDSVISQCKKKTATSKKDGHTKIYTAQGPRDRRVRLSIDISRKFFCLQDLLGFDKASKTLDWLFTKSKIAIQELVEETTHSSSSTVTDQSKLQFLETINAGSVEDKARKKKSVPKYCLVGKKRKPTQRCKTGFRENYARDQSRAEARARARERTREKMRVRKLDDDLKTLVPDCCESGYWVQTEPRLDYRGHHMGVHNGSRNFKAI